MGLSEDYPAYGGRGPGDLSLGLGLGSVATVFIILRVYVRLRVNKFGTAALLWTLTAWIFTTISQSVATVAILHGLGNHIEIVEEHDNLRQYLLLTWITVFMFSIAIPLGKCAVCSFLIEMNGQGNPRIRLSLIVCGVVNVILSIPMLVIVWAHCSPPHALWDPTLQYQCNTKMATDYLAFVGAVAAASDLYLAIIPAAMLIPLKIDAKLKWGLSFLMGCGVFAAAAAIVRAWSANALNNTDSTWESGVLFRWGEIEEWVVLICMSIPPVWPLFRPITSKFLNSGAKSYPNQGLNYTSKGYNQFASTGPQETIVDPPVVTTTIHISSNKVPVPGVKPTGTSSSSAESLIVEEGPQTTLRTHGGGEAEGWVEMSQYNKHQTYE
ncbi:hypothetical protein N7495_006300 [Penicillium taxi]|uniref:uncharacterized protein n=1 Tax=Penicillium taxi TaxID=168475 RepID=UPI0025455D36|nr:uncharacterized protein N7495_006300 [Penicillium taxi]KAJ5894609.1 hypothetical protein N7495_006300 [Penicillium taxi]